MKKLHPDAKNKLRQLYNHANVLQNVAWEAALLYSREITKILDKCKTREEFVARKRELHELLKHESWMFPTNPKPNRPDSHSGDMDTFDFWVYELEGQKFPNE